MVVLPRGFTDAQLAGNPGIVARASKLNGKHGPLTERWSRDLGDEVRMVLELFSVQDSRTQRAVVREVEISLGWSGADAPRPDQLVNVWTVRDVLVALVGIELRDHPERFEHPYGRVIDVADTVRRVWPAAVSATMNYPRLKVTDPTGVYLFDLP